MRENIEYWLVLVVARTLGWLPRRCAQQLANLLVWGAYRSLGRLRRVGERNLQLALPELGAEEHGRILRGVFRHLGWQLVEFCRMSRYTAENTRGWIGVEYIWIDWEHCNESDNVSETIQLRDRLLRAAEKL